MRVPGRYSGKNEWFKKYLEQASLPSLRKLQWKYYFTNGDRVKGDDPYAVLGLTWGATNTEIKEAYRKLAQKYHPDAAGSSQENGSSLESFQKIQKAYSCLMNVRNLRFSHTSKDTLELYSFQTWRLADVIAQERTDVAGLVKKRPIQPATDGKRALYTLGQPDGTGVWRREEYVTDGSEGATSTLRAKKNTGTVGTGRNKWIKPPQWKPWNPQEKQQIGRADIHHPHTDDEAKNECMPNSQK